MNKEFIESLGFKYVLHNVETNTDFTFNKPYKNGFKYCLVWHPDKNEIVICFHRTACSRQEIIDSFERLYYGENVTPEILKSVLDILEKTKIK